MARVKDQKSSEDMELIVEETYHTSEVSSLATVRQAVIDHEKNAHFLLLWL